MFRRQHSSVLQNTQRFPERTHFLNAFSILTVIQSNADSIPPSFILSDMSAAWLQNWNLLCLDSNSSVIYVSRRGSQNKKEHWGEVSALGQTDGKVEHHGLWNKLCWEFRADLSLPLKFQRKSFFLSQSSRTEKKWHVISLSQSKIAWREMALAEENILCSFC